MSTEMNHEGTKDTKVFELWTWDRIGVQQIKQRMLGRTKEVDFFDDRMLMAYILAKPRRYYVWGRTQKFIEVTKPRFLEFLNDHRLYTKI